MIHQWAVKQYDIYRALSRHINDIRFLRHDRNTADLLSYMISIHHSNGIDLVAPCRIFRDLLHDMLCFRFARYDHDLITAPTLTIIAAHIALERDPYQISHDRIDNDKISQ